MSATIRHQQRSLVGFRIRNVAIKRHQWQHRGEVVGVPNPADVQATFQLDDTLPLFAIGTFDQGVTLLSQQRRALNLAWSLIETRQVPLADDVAKRVRIAIIGAGFAGLTLAAALFQKRAKCEVVIFEERDTLLPLQQGSDTRWLHPHIYNWPAEGSEATAAMLPVLNWTAARASDVVVQALTSWRTLLRNRRPEIKLFCNVRHLQVSRQQSDTSKAQVEWVGEEREPRGGSIQHDLGGSQGESQSFDIVVLAVGFGLEVGQGPSYWRNETISQPGLEQPSRTYLVSGQGDGAMIDLLRIRVSQFRQDRILDELFQGKADLLAELKGLRDEYDSPPEGYSLFGRLDELARSETIAAEQLRGAIRALGKRLRRDTDVVLRLKVRNLAELLGIEASRTSFQNGLLIYLLYRCGGFAPSTEPEKSLAKRLKIPSDQIIVRHGTARLQQLERLLAPGLYEPVRVAWETDQCAGLRQADSTCWEGGYFGIPARSADAERVADEQRDTWRKEYLPGPTALLATALVGAIAGAIAAHCPTAKNFRVTLHRSITIGEDELLQQACDYGGRGLTRAESTAGRTFPARNATIGLAYKTRRIVRSKKGLTFDQLERAMQKLDLNRASRRMRSEVRFVLAIPLLQPEGGFFLPYPVTGVLYVDSADEGFWLSDDQIGQLVSMVEQSMEGLQLEGEIPVDRIRNTRLKDITDRAPSPEPVPSGVANEFEALDSVAPPLATKPFVLNYDHSDLTPMMVERGKTEEPSPVES